MACEARVKRKVKAIVKLEYKNCADDYALADAWKNPDINVNTHLDNISSRYNEIIKIMNEKCPACPE